MFENKVPEWKFWVPTVLSIVSSLIAFVTWNTTAKTKRAMVGIKDYGLHKELDAGPSEAFRDYSLAFTLKNWGELPGTITEFRIGILRPDQNSLFQISWNIAPTSPLNPGTELPSFYRIVQLPTLQDVNDVNFAWDQPDQTSFPVVLKYRVEYEDGKFEQICHYFRLGPTKLLDMYKASEYPAIANVLPYNFKRENCTISPYFTCHGEEIKSGKCIQYNPS